MAASSARITYAEDLGTEVVSIYVGPDRKRYVVHKQLLTSQSDYFDKALNGKFKEAEENEIHLEEDDTTAVGLMIGWLYRGVIPGTGKKLTPFTRAMAGSNENVKGVEPPPVPENGTSVPFTPLLAADFYGVGNARNTAADHSYVNICFNANYDKFSQEELRLSDYRLNRKFACNAPALPQTTGPVPYVRYPIFRPPNAGWGGIMPQLSGTQLSSGPTSIFGSSLSGPQSSPQPTAPVGAQPSSQPTSLFGSLTSGSQPSILQMPLPPQPSLFSSSPQPASQTASQNPITSNSGSALPTSSSTRAFSNFFTPSPSVSGTTGVTGSSPWNFTGASSASGTTRTTGPSFGFVGASSASGTTPASGTIRATVPSIFSPAGAPSVSGTGVGAASSIFSLSSAPSGSGTSRNTGLSIFGNLHAAGVRDATLTPPNPKPAPKKPGEFGYSPTINYPKPNGAFIERIPRSEPIGDLMVDEIELQDALLHLCIFAETVCWPKLFNAAIDSYMLGELNMRRDILLEHVDLIYNHTHSDSSLRAFVLDSIRRLTNPNSYKAYMELAQQHEDFLANLLKAVSLGPASKGNPSTFTELKKSYFMSEEPFAPPKKAFADNDGDEL